MSEQTANLASLIYRWVAQNYGTDEADNPSWDIFELARAIVRGRPVRASIPPAEYLGDGVYVQYSGYDFRLFTERETGVHEIFLEPWMITNLNKFVQQQKEKDQ